MINDLENFIKKNKDIIRYKGIEPDGFMLLHEKTLEDLKNFDLWKDWKNGLITLQEINNSNITGNYI